MQKKKYLSTEMIVSIGLLTAISIVLTRFLMFEPTPNIRVTFGNLPIILSGLMFGPIAGAITGFLADFLGTTFFSPYTWFAPLGVSPIVIGLLPGLLRVIFIKRRTVGSLLVSLIPAYVLGPLLWSTFSLHLLYGTSLAVMLTTRIPVSAAIAVFEIIVTCLFVKSGLFRAIGLPELTLRKGKFTEAAAIKAEEKPNEY
jgi:ECF transporter S component (folate family)